MDSERINARLTDLSSFIGELKKLPLPKNVGDYERSSPAIKRAVERDLQLISEAELEIMVQVYKNLNLKAPGEEESIINAMEMVMDRELVKKAKERRELRNHLVHAYFNIDDKKVFMLASDVRDIEQFTAAVRKIVNKYTSH